jgi:hypothetical protein
MIAQRTIVCTALLTFDRVVTTLSACSSVSHAAVTKSQTKESARDNNNETIAGVELHCIGSGTPACHEFLSSGKRVDPFAGQGPVPVGDVPWLQTYA